MQEIYEQKTDRQLAAKQRIIAVAAGREGRPCFKKRKVS